MQLQIPLKKAVLAAPAGHLTTGIFGTKYALEVLSERISPKFVFDMVNGTEYPGWGHRWTAEPRPSGRHGRKVTILIPTVIPCLERSLNGISAGWGGCGP